MLQLIDSKKLFCVDAFQNGDRFSHSIRSLNHDLRLFESIESDDQEAWPRSPAIQELVPHPSEGNAECLLGVGHAGTAYYSISFAAPTMPNVESVIPHGQHQILLTCEVACRIRQNPGRIGQSYHLASGLGLRQLDESETFELLASDQVLAFLLLKNATIQVDDSEFEITPNALSIEKFPATIDWSWTLAAAK